MNVKLILDVCLNVSPDGKAIRGVNDAVDAINNNVIKEKIDLLKEINKQVKLGRSHILSKIAELEKQLL